MDEADDIYVGLEKGIWYSQVITRKCSSMSFISCMPRQVFDVTKILWEIN